jgi:hypothetical protein
VLDRLDSDRVVVDVERACGFAGRGQIRPVNSGKIVGRVEHIERRSPLVAVRRSFQSGMMLLIGQPV